MSRESFRPLAGISCVEPNVNQNSTAFSFRPLAGISCVPDSNPLLWVQPGGFRPLAGISCVMEFRANAGHIV